jgi:hypothetical protein
LYFKILANVFGIFDNNPILNQYKIFWQTLKCYGKGILPDLVKVSYSKVHVAHEVSQLPSIKASRG